jgi:hypothetical protein
MWDLTVASQVALHFINIDENLAFNKHKNGHVHEIDIMIFISKWHNFTIITNKSQIHKFRFYQLLPLVH